MRRGRGLPSLRSRASFLVRGGARSVPLAASPRRVAFGRSRSPAGGLSFLLVLSRLPSAVGPPSPPAAFVRFRPAPSRVSRWSGFGAPLPACRVCPVRSAPPRLPRVRFWRAVFPPVAFVRFGPPLPVCRVGPVPAPSPSLLLRLCPVVSVSPPPRGRGAPGSCRCGPAPVRRSPVVAAPPPRLVPCRSLPFASAVPVAWSLLGPCWALRRGVSPASVPRPVPSCAASCRAGPVSPVRGGSPLRRLSFRAAGFPAACPRPPV